MANYKEVEEKNTSKLLASALSYNNKMLEEKRLKYGFNFTTCMPMDEAEINELKEKKQKEQKAEQKKKEQNPAKPQEDPANPQEDPANAQQNTKNLVFSNNPLTEKQKAKLFKRFLNKPFII